MGALASRQQQTQEVPTTDVLAVAYNVPRVEELMRRGVPEHLYFYSLVSSPMKDDRAYAVDSEDGAEGGEVDGDVDVDMDGSNICQPSWLPLLPLARNNSPFSWQPSS